MSVVDQELIADLNRHMASMNNATEDSSETGMPKPEIYNLLDLAGRGLLAEKMEQSLINFDMNIVDDAIREHVTPYLYNEGAGKWIPKNMLVSRRIEDFGGTSATIAANFQHRKIKQYMAKDQPYQKFVNNSANEFLEYKIHGLRKTSSASLDGEDRFCCWDIWRRGTMGETILHVCLMCGSRVARQLAQRLLLVFPMLVVDIYLSNEYYGQTPLHMALVNEDLIMAKKMMDLKDPETGQTIVDLSARCNGCFFIPLDQKSELNFNPKIGEVPVLTTTKTNYAAPCYWGEFPLSFAVCLGLDDAVTWLLHRGASPSAVDLNGNNILHMLVLHNKLEMFKTVIELLDDSVLTDLLDTRNKQNYLPLTLAAYCGRKDIFNLILSYQSKVLWVYGALHAVEYLLTDLDTIRPDGSLNKKSALHIIATKSRNFEGHSEMLTGVLKELVDWKWALFGRQMLFANFSVYFLFLLSYLLGMYLRRPATMNSSASSSCYMREVNNNVDYVLTAIEIWTYLQLLLRVLVEVRQLRTLGWILWTSELAIAPTKILFLVGVFILIPLSVLMKIICRPAIEDGACILTVICITPHLLFYIRSTRFLGPLVIVMYRAVYNDLRRFLVILLILLTAYSLSTVVVFKRSTQDSPFNSFFLTMYYSFCMVLGEVTPEIYNELERSPYPYITRFNWIFFFFLAHLLLVNVLVGMVYETFHVYKKSHHEWYKERTRLVVMYEHLLTDKCRRLVLQQYSQPVAAMPSLDEFTQRMMISPGWKSGGQTQTQKQVPSNKKVDYPTAEHHHKCQPDERKVTVKHYFKDGKNVSEIMIPKRPK